ncbi:hypothetical protein ACHAWF_006946 [Thalassiosira exigua]
MALEEGPSEKEPLLSMRNDYGLNEATEEMVEGRYVTEQDAPPAFIAWVKALFQTEKEREPPPILGGVSTEMWQHRFPSSDESTSSEPNRMNYTVLKALAQSRYISEIMVIMASLPFIYGFVNKSGEAMKNFEAGDPSDEQWGFRRDRTAINAALVKLLTYEVSRTAVLTIGDTQCDNSQCFDRIWPEFLNIGLCCMNVQDKLLISPREGRATNRRRDPRQGRCPSHIVSSTIFDPSSERSEIISDGSCHIQEQIAGAAWLIEGATRTEEACILLHGQTTSCTGFRSESEGLFRSLHHLQRLNVCPKEVVQWCDNEYADDSSNLPRKTPREVMSSEADIIMAIHDLKSRLPFPVVGRHVYGHQDTRGKRTKTKQKTRTRRVQIENELEMALHPSESEESASTTGSESTATEGPRNPYDKPRKPLPLEVRNNFRCDKMVSETTAIAVEGGIHSLPPMPMTLEPPYRGSRAIA